jgi:predicted DNA-binding protein (MmcQ/YjbR family)
LSLYQRDHFDQAVTQLPGVTMVDQWDARVAKVGGKVFCLLSDASPHRLVFKCGEASFDILTALDDIEQAAYFAKRKWVSVKAGAPLSDGDLGAYIQRSYALVAAGLTRKAREELGIALT